MFHVGTSGWSYPEWHGPFYPPELPARRELEYASQAFATLEINRSFYSLLTPATYLAWYAQTPRHFLFALKGGQFITHAKRLRDVHTPLANFFASGVLALEDKLGPIVWQLPRNFRFEQQRLAAFFEVLPRTTGEAALLARQHDARVRHGAHLEVRVDRPLRHALEPRHESFRDPAFARLMRQAGAAIVVSDSPDWPRLEELGADFAYVRLHGAQQTYRSRYGASALGGWARRIQGWARGELAPDAARISALRPKHPRAIYVYFDNDSGAHAPRDALGLRERLGLRPGDGPRAQRASPGH